jgi:flagellar protein FliS
MPVYDIYLESQVMAADPLELVRLLYRAAGDATRNARAHMTAGRIGERSREISKTHAILAQLSVTLDHARGGALSRSLAELYDYMQRRLLDANQRQEAQPLVEVESLLTTLLEGWEQVRSTPENGPVESPRSPVVEERATEYGGYHAMFETAPAAQCYSQSWSA